MGVTITVMQYNASTAITLFKCTDIVCLFPRAMPTFTPVYTLENQPLSYLWVWKKVQSIAET